MAMFLGRITVETPKYDLITKNPVYEIRRYHPQVRAEVLFDPNDKKNDRDSGGFWPLANYIFGKNQVRGADGKPTEIAMTAPVITERPSEKIQMTAPVVTEGTGDSMQRMSFVMPSKYSRISDLPVPSDPRVALKEVPQQTLAVITFSGFWSEEIGKKKEKELREACKQDSIALKTDENSAITCRYNPPWTIPFFRTNEVMIPLAE
ncbi:hypothetical protein HDU67_008965 [Dinochytrium kinnereticum]|nr:hypothetical protein HDU67_008965 [Dinochytrium kinnereticum]